MTSIMLLAHPGHELRAYNWMERNRPTVFVLTDGAGSGSAGRTASTRKVVDLAGARCGRRFGNIEDQLFYQDILNHDIARLHESLMRIYEFVRSQATDDVTIAGDAIEGYNPAHDIARYSINMLCHRLRQDGLGVSNYAFSLIDNPAAAARRASGRDLVLRLSDEQFGRKIEAAGNYSELAREVAGATADVGEESLRFEVLQWIDPDAALIPPPHSPVYYEAYGRARVRQGTYTSPILFAEHVAPTAEKLWAAFGCQS